MQGNETEPSDFLVGNIDLLPKGKVLDVAMGDGRNAIYLAKMGFDVDGVDICEKDVQNAQKSAKRAGVAINGWVADLEQHYRFMESAYDIVVCFNYLYRSLIPHIKAAIRDKGIIVYETHIVDQAQFGRPSHPDDLLTHNELLDMFHDFRCLRYQEGIFPGPKTVAGIIAQKI